MSAKTESTDPPLVSIITVNYMQSHVTNELLNSLRHLTWPNWEVVVVDNSLNGDHENIDNSYPNVRIVVNSINNGFAGANNLGIRHSKGEYILLLNNDTEVDPGLIEPMLKLFRTKNYVGAVSPKIKFFHEPQRIQYAGYTRMHPVTLRMKAVGSRQADDGRFDLLAETPFAHGCAMMISRKVIDTVGYMPEEFFLYYEEHDWSMRIRRCGFRIFYQPQSVVYHKESVSVKKGSTLKTYYINRNRILYMRRNFNAWRKLFAWTYILLISIPWNTMKYLSKKEINHLNAYLKAIIWNMNHKAGLL